MPVGTVRGRYELDAPALRTLKDLERQGIRTQKQIDEVGRSLDKVSGKWVEHTRVVKREVDAQQRAIHELEVSLDHLDRKRANPKIDLEGVTAALAQVELLEARLDRLNRQRITPRIAMGGGFGSAGRLGGGAFGGGPVPPVTGTMRGGGGGAIRSVGIGALNFGSGPGLALIGGALPALQALGGSAFALGGSAGAGLLGAGALGIAGAGGLAAGGLGAYATIKPLASQISAASKAQNALTQAVANFGRESAQAAAAKRKLDAAMNTAPAGTRQFLRDLQGIRSEWGRLSRPGQEDIMQLMGFAVRRGRSFIRAAGAPAANRVSGALNREGQRFASFVTGPTGQRFARQGAAIFDENLGNFRQAGQYGLEAFVNVMQAARPFFREATTWLRDWTRGWATGTRDIQHTREEIGKLVDHLRSWTHLGGAAVRLLKDLGSAGAPEGRSMIERLTVQLGVWDQWVQRNPEKVRDFFRRTVNSTVEMARALGQVAKALNSIATLLSPVLDRFMQLVSLAGKLGMLQPGAGALALGAFRGFRGGGGGSAGGGAVGGVLGGAGAASGRPLVYSSPAYAGVGTARAASAGIFGNWRTNNALRNQAASGIGPGGTTAALAALSMRGSQGLTLRGAVGGSTYGLARSFGRGRLASAAAQGGAMLGGLGGSRVGGALMGAGRAFLPFAALSAVLQASATEGDFGHKAWGGLSAATLGLIPGPRSSAQIADAGLQQAAEAMAGAPSGMTVAATQARLERLRALNAAAVRDSTARGGKKGFFGGYGFLGAFQAGHGGDHGISTDEAATNRAAAKAYQWQIRDTAAALRQLRDAAHQAARAQSVQRGSTIAAQIQEGYHTRVGKYGNTAEGRTRAGQESLTSLKSQFDRLGPVGAKSLASSSMQWASALAGGNKQLGGQFLDLERDVIKRFHGMARQIAVINGQIKVGTSKEWGSISEAIGSAALRGVDEASAEFQRLRAVAIGALRDMGFTAAQAAGIMKGTSTITQMTGGRVAGAQALGAARGLGASGARYSALAKTYPSSAKTRPAGGPSPEDRAAHFGTAQNFSNASAGLMGANPGLGIYDQDARRFGLRISSGRRPGSITASGNTSLHASGDAIDESGSAADMLRYARYMVQRYGSGLDELIHTPLGYGIKNGQRVPLSFWGDAVNRMHYNHVHVGDRTPGGALRGAAGGGGLGGAVGGIHLRARRSRLGGAPGALASRAMAGYALGLQTAVNGALGGGGAAAPGGKYNTAALASLWVAAGGPSNVARLMGAIAMAESGGNPAAHNASGADGLWQILGVPFAGNTRDPMTNARMAVAKYSSQGLGAWEAYTNGSYRRFLGAFRRGGSFVTRPGRAGMFVAGEGPNREEVIVRPHKPDRKLARRSSGGGSAASAGVHVAVTVAGDMVVRSDADVDAIAEKIGKKLLDALETTVPDSELMGG